MINMINNVSYWSKVKALNTMVPFERIKTLLKHLLKFIFWVNVNSIRTTCIKYFWQQKHLGWSNSYAKILFKLDLHHNIWVILWSRFEFIHFKDSDETAPPLPVFKCDRRLNSDPKGKLFGSKDVFTPAIFYCMNLNYSLSNGLYCTKWEHSHLQFFQLLCEP